MGREGGEVGRREGKWGGERVSGEAGGGGEVGGGRVSGEAGG